MRHHIRLQEWQSRDQTAEVAVLFWFYRTTDYAYTANGSYKQHTRGGIVNPFFLLGGWFFLIKIFNHVWVI
jgi:hypothetical protein